MLHNLGLCDMNLRQLDVFKAIMECGSITVAATTLFVSQPAVSKSLRALELELGFKLFIRTPNGLTPTGEARSLYSEVKRAYAGLAAINRFAQDLKAMKHRRLVVSSVPSLSRRWLPIVASKFMADYPDASLSLNSWSSPQTAQIISEGHANLGIAQSRIEDPGVTRTLISAIEAVCILPRGHPMEGESVITPDHLRGQRFISLAPQDVIRLQLERLLEESGVEISRNLEVAMGMTLCRIVDQGFGIGIADSETVSNLHIPNTVIRPFCPRIEIPVFLMRAARKPMSIIEAKFIEYIHATPIQTVQVA